MKSTGIIRKIDELGRIVIPKEIRKNFKIREGDQLEIHVDSEGEIILKKHAPLEDIKNLIVDYAEIISAISGFNCCFFNTDKVISCFGTDKKIYESKEITDEVRIILDERNIFSTINSQPISIIEEKVISKPKSQVIVPIICDGDVLGAISMFSYDLKKIITENEIKLAKTAAIFLGKQFEV